MRSFQRPATLDPVPGTVVALLRRIDLAVGAEARHADQLPELLRSLSGEARVESITASSAIEGVVVDESRAPGILAGRTAHLRDRSEAELAGYTAALDHLLREDPGDLSVGLILHLHRLLFSRTDGDGGSFKTEDNLVVDRDPDGARRVRFEPVSARQTPHFVEELVVRTNAALAEGVHHPLLVIAAFGLDLLCIHPFADGNGRVTRLATSHLLLRADYGVGRYVSIEQALYETKDEYYDALAQSTADWFDDGAHSLWPWADYLLERIATAYDRFEAWLPPTDRRAPRRSVSATTCSFTRPRRSPSPRSGVRLPGISDQTIRLVLTELRDQGLIRADAAGRNATWHRH